ncbi:hypothetical protein U1Q18_038596, partial [Sarracenia purpurea var. burkii]
EGSNFRNSDLGKIIGQKIPMKKLAARAKLLIFFKGAVIRWNSFPATEEGPGGMIGTRWAKMRFGGTNGRVAEELPLLETAVVKKTNRAATSGYLQSDWIKPVAARQGATPQCGAGLVADRSNYSAKITHL